MILKERPHSQHVNHSTYQAGSKGKCAVGQPINLRKRNLWQGMMTCTLAAKSVKHPEFARDPNNAISKTARQALSSFDSASCGQALLNSPAFSHLPICGRCLTKSPLLATSPSALCFSFNIPFGCPGRRVSLWWRDDKRGRA